MFNKFVPEAQNYMKATKFAGSLARSEGVYIPVGSVSTWKAAETKYDLKQARKNPPEDWHELNGAAFSPLTHWRLFCALGYRYGRAGLKFRIPDWRGIALGETIRPNTKVFNPGTSPMYLRYMIKVR